MLCLFCFVSILLSSAVRLMSVSFILVVIILEDSFFDSVMILLIDSILLSMSVSMVLFSLCRYWLFESSTIALPLSALSILRSLSFSFFLSDDTALRCSLERLSGVSDFGWVSTSVTEAAKADSTA